MKTSHYLLRRLAPFVGFFLILEFIVRLSLALYQGNNLEGAGKTLPEAFLIGFAFDGLHISLPFGYSSPLRSLLPQKFRRAQRQSRQHGNLLYFQLCFIVLGGRWMAVLGWISNTLQFYSRRLPRLHKRSGRQYSGVLSSWLAVKRHGNHQCSLLNGLL